MKRSGFATLAVLPILLAATTAFAQQQTPPPAPTPAPAIAANAPHAADIQAARQAAEAWIQLLDDGKFDQAYLQMGMTAHRQISQQQWRDQLNATRARYGTLESRIFQYPNYTTTLKNAPPGQYVVLNYLCTFSSHLTSPETVVMTKVGTGWMVAGFQVE
jgi:hypothetical protein